MSPILDRVGKRANGAFRPSSPQELATFRLACHLGEPESAAYFGSLLRQYSLDYLLATYRKAKAMLQPGEHLATIFHYCLSNHPLSVPEPYKPKVLAIRIERRNIAAAVFAGTRLKAVRLRVLPTEKQKAPHSAAAFMGSLLEDFEPEQVIIESLAANTGRRRPAIFDAVRNRLEDGSVPVMEIALPEVLAGFGHPALLNRRGLRDAVAVICPDVSLKANHVSGYDAVALGLYAQTERLFNN